jgi:hypothetical protein
MKKRERERMKKRNEASSEGCLAALRIKPTAPQEFSHVIQK